MFRRTMVKLMGAGSAGALLATSQQAQAAQSTAQSIAEAAAEATTDISASTRVGGLDLNDIEVIDTHVHPVMLNTITDSYTKQAANFTDVMMPAGDYPGKAELQAKMHQGFTELVYEQQRRIGYFNYIARTYGVPATAEGFNSVVKPNIGNNADFEKYIKKILDREKIASMVFQSREPDPVPPVSHMPPNRFVWSWPYTDMLRPDWAKTNGLNTLQDVQAAIDKRLETAAANGCRGFKNGAAYWRSFALARVTARQAEEALKLLLAATPDSVDTRNVPSFDDPKLTAALRTYEDFLFKHVYVKAGQIEVPMIIHTAVGLHPGLRSDWNSPQPLYEVFVDDDVQKANTQFILIHSGYPSHHIVSGFISQLPNVYTDVSFFAKYPGALEEVYRTFLTLGPATKIMHGSDSNTVPEEIGYCAWNGRAALARVLNEYRHYGWTNADIEKTANDILHGNARRFFRIPS